MKNFRIFPEFKDFEDGMSSLKMLKQADYKGYSFPNDNPGDNPSFKYFGSSSFVGGLYV